jgi:glutathione S-transferase
MQLYYHPSSTNARRARITAVHLGIELEERLVDLTKGEHKAPEYLALNPNGAVPTLVDADFVLTESRAIMQYLAARRPDSSLLPRDEKQRTDVVRWQFWDASHFSPAVGTIFFERILKRLFGRGDPDERRIEEALVNHRRFMGVLNTRLAGRRFVVGGGLTLADLTLATSLMYAHELALPIAEFPNVEAWLSAVKALDAWKRTEPSA